MNITFVNHSKITIHIMINSDELLVAPNYAQSIVSDSNSINVGFFPDGKSFLNRHKSFEFQLLSSYVISSVNSEVIIYMNAYKTGGDNWEDYSYVLLSGNMADARLQSLSVVDKNEIINEIINEDLNKRNRESFGKTDFKISVILETILSSVPVMFVVYLIAKHFLNMKTILLILFFIFIFIFLIILVTNYIYEKVAKRFKNNHSNHSNNSTYMLDENYIRYVVFDIKRYRNIL